MPDSQWIIQVRFGRDAQVGWRQHGIFVVGVRPAHRAIEGLVRVHTDLRKVRDRIDPVLFVPAAGHRVGRGSSGLPFTDLCRAALIRHRRVDARMRAVVAKVRRLAAAAAPPESDATQQEHPKPKKNPAQLTHGTALHRRHAHGLVDGDRDEARHAWLMHRHAQQLRGHLHRRLVVGNEDELHS